MVPSLALPQASRIQKTEQTIYKWLLFYLLCLVGATYSILWTGWNALAPQFSGGAAVKFPLLKSVFLAQAAAWFGGTIIGGPWIDFLSYRGPQMRQKSSQLPAFLVWTSYLHVLMGVFIVSPTVWFSLNGAGNNGWFSLLGACNTSRTAEVLTVFAATFGLVIGAWSVVYNVIYANIFGVARLGALDGISVGLNIVASGIGPLVFTSQISSIEVSAEHIVRTVREFYPLVPIFLSPCTSSREGGKFITPIRLRWCADNVSSDCGELCGASMAMSSPPRADVVGRV